MLCLSSNLTPSVLSRGLAASLYLLQITKKNKQIYFCIIFHTSQFNLELSITEFLTELSHSLTFVCPLVHAYHGHCWLCIEHPFYPLPKRTPFYLVELYSSSPCTPLYRRAMCLIHSTCF